MGVLELNVGGFVCTFWAAEMGTPPPSSLWTRRRPRTSSRFYEQVFPVAEEREYFQRVVAHALFGAEPAKIFLVLTDERDGSNGKTTLMRTVEAVFGRYTSAAPRDFLYTSHNAQPEGHSATTLSFAGKRLAFFDEPDADKKLDTRKIKDLTSGDARIRGRVFNSAEVVDFAWSALIVIACNQSNFPRMDASDRPFIARNKVLKMRSLFVAHAVLSQMLEVASGAGEASEAGQAECAEPSDPPSHEDEYLDHVFEMEGDGFKVRLKDGARLAHLHLLAAAYRRTLAAGGFGPEPACVKEMGDKLTAESDPVYAHIIEFVDENVDFNPPRAPEFAGHKYYAWITFKELKKRVVDHLGGLRPPVKERSDKIDTLLLDAMKSRGRARIELRLKLPDGKRVDPQGFDRVSFKKGGLD